MYKLDLRKDEDNIKLQKLLFFAWLIHYKNNNEYLFETEFIACEHGPGLPELEEARLKYNNINKINNVHDTISETVVLFGQDIEYMDEFNELYNKIRSMKSE